jgi:hypothetical protein
VAFSLRRLINVRRGHRRARCVAHNLLKSIFFYKKVAKKWQKNGLPKKSYG